LKKEIRRSQGAGTLLTQRTKVLQIEQGIQVKVVGLGLVDRTELEPSLLLLIVFPSTL